LVALLNLAHLQGQQGQFAAAQRTLSQAQGLGGGGEASSAIALEAASLYAHSLAQGKSLPNAANELRQRLAELEAAGEQSPRFFTLQAQAALVQDVKSNPKAPQQAAEALAKTLSANPHFVPALVQAGKLYTQNRQWQAAKAVLAQAYDLAPHFPPTLDALAVLMQALHEPQQAIAWANKAELVDVAPTTPTQRTRLLASQYEQLGDAKQAATLYQSLQQQAPNDPTLALKIATQLEQSGQQPAAIAAYRQAMQHNPHFLQQWQHQAEVLIANQQPQQALPLLQKILVLAPTHEAALQALLLTQQLAQRDKQPTQPELIAGLLAALKGPAPQGTLADDWQLMRLKAKRLQANGALTPALSEGLAAMRQSPLPWVKAEACFWLGCTLHTEPGWEEGWSQLPQGGGLSPAQRTALGLRWQALRFNQGAFDVLAALLRDAPHTKGIDAGVVQPAWWALQQLKTQSVEALGQVETLLAVKVDKRNVAVWQQQQVALGQRLAVLAQQDPANPVLAQARHRLQEATAGKVRGAAHPFKTRWGG
jgi:tetratricopeptide (TPR) repeat protein